MRKLGWAASCLCNKLLHFYKKAMCHQHDPLRVAVLSSVWARRMLSHHVHVCCIITRATNMPPSTEYTLTTSNLCISHALTPASISRLAVDAAGDAVRRQRVYGAAPLLI